MTEQPTEYILTLGQVIDTYAGRDRILREAALHAVAAHDAEVTARARAEERERIAEAIEAAAYTLVSLAAGTVALSVRRQAASIARGEAS